MERFHLEHELVDRRRLGIDVLNDRLSDCSWSPDTSPYRPPFRDEASDTFDGSRSPTPVFFSDASAPPPLADGGSPDSFDCYPFPERRPRERSPSPLPVARSPPALPITKREPDDSDSSSSYADPYGTPMKMQLFRRKRRKLTPSQICRSADTAFLQNVSAVYHSQSRAEDKKRFLADQIPYGIKARGNAVSLIFVPEEETNRLDSQLYDVRQTIDEGDSTCLHQLIRNIRCKLKKRPTVPSERQAVSLPDGGTLYHSPQKTKPTLHLLLRAIRNICVSFNRISYIAKSKHYCPAGSIAANSLRDQLTRRCGERAKLPSSIRRFLRYVNIDKNQDLCWVLAGMLHQTPHMWARSSRLLARLQTFLQNSFLLLFQQLSLNIIDLFEPSYQATALELLQAAQQLDSSQLQIVMPVLNAQSMKYEIQKPEETTVCSSRPTQTKPRSKKRRKEAEKTPPASQTSPTIPATQTSPTIPSPDEDQEIGDAIRALEQHSMTPKSSSLSSPRLPPETSPPPSDRDLSLTEKSTPPKPKRRRKTSQTRPSQKDDEAVPNGSPPRSPTVDPPTLSENALSSPPHSPPNSITHPFLDFSSTFYDFSENAAGQYPYTMTFETKEWNDVSNNSCQHTVWTSETFS